MKNGEHIIKKCLVVSLLVVYLFIALVYILFLPRYNSITSPPSSFSSVLHLRKSDGSSNASLQFHRLFKTVIPGKDKTLSSVRMLTVVFLLIFSGLVFLKFNKSRKHYTVYSFYFQRPVFLDFCSLRI